jgi:tryptophan synthase alpha chain
MSSRYQARFEKLNKENRKAFIPFTVLGWPSKDASLTIIKQMMAEGASALELGIAFSDPIADGPVIQQAATETLATGFKLQDALELVKTVRALDADIPIGLLIYYNMVVAKGIPQFFKAAKDAGVDGVLIADLPPESADEVAKDAKDNQIDLIYLVSPVTTEARIQKIVSEAGGFIYLISRLGVTGTQERSETKDQVLTKLIKDIKQKTKVPVYAGFGISNAQDAKRILAAGADGVITGSKVIQLARGENNKPNLEALATYYKEMLSAVNSPLEKHVSKP